MLFRLTAAAMLAAIPAIALAQEPSKPAEEDKPVTRIELSAKLDADYADLDADKDGKVTPGEINSRLAKDAAAKVEELKKERDASFTRFDTNADGSISKAEFDARAKLPTVREPDPKPVLDRFDANKDGAITKDEFRAPTLANFEKMDRDKDGTVSLTELKAPTPSTPATAAKPKAKPTFKKTPAIRN